MVMRLWLERFLEGIADRGREFLRLRTDEAAVPRLGALCRDLLSGLGEASGTALSREVLRAYEHMDDNGRRAFFEMLAADFGPDPAAIRAATEAFLRANDAATLHALTAAVEPPRQELFRRINMAPKGTAALVAMRAELLGLLAQHPPLRSVDADMKHLFGSWFNRGFLRLQRIDWHSPADLLEKLIRYDMVQTIRSWDDLRRRLAADRRCFAFFHPALPDEPLIFLEVALVHGMADKVTPLLDDQAPVLRARDADTAMFISINSTQPGLRGLSFGNLLIKQVAEDLKREFPHLRSFATLSPIPGLRRWLGRTETKTLLAMGPNAEARLALLARIERPGWHTGAPFSAETMQLRPFALDAKGEPFTHPAAVEAQHQTRAAGRAAVVHGVDAERTMVAGEHPMMDLGKCKPRLPHERAVAEYPKIA